MAKKERYVTGAKTSKIGNAASYAAGANLERNFPGVARDMKRRKTGTFKGRNPSDFALGLSAAERAAGKKPTDKRMPTKKVTSLETNKPKATLQRAKPTVKATGTTSKKSKRTTRQMDRKSARVTRKKK